MDYFGSESYINAGLPKLTTIPPVSSEDGEGGIATAGRASQIATQTQTPISSSSSYQPSNALPPTIDEMLSGNSSAPYTRNHFAQYLLQRHCLENLEFYLEIEKFYQLSNIVEKEYNWKYLYNSFIEPDSPKEINLPASIRDNFDVNLVPSNQFLQEAAKTVFDYLHEAYVGFIASTEQLQIQFKQEQEQALSNGHHQKLHNHDHYSHQAPIPHYNSGTDTTSSSRCISPLSPSESAGNTIHQNNSIQAISGGSNGVYDNDLPFDMSDDGEDIEIDCEETEIAVGGVKSNEEDQTIISSSGRNSSVSSSHSSSNKFNSFVGSFKNNDSNWKKAAKKLKWRRSSYSSSE